LAALGRWGIRVPFRQNVRPVNKQKVQINIQKMKKEQKLEQQQNSDSDADIMQVSPTCPKPNVSGSAYNSGPHMDWWNGPVDRFAMLKKYGYQDKKKPWKYRPLSDKGIYLMWSAENCR
jgi:hypothetical protein